jgi:hypothetical protein
MYVSFGVLSTKGNASPTVQITQVGCDDTVTYLSRSSLLATVFEEPNLPRLIILLTLLMGVAQQPMDAAASAIGAGTSVTSTYVDRDSTRGGPAVQPSVWVDVSMLSTLVSAWASVSLQESRIDHMSIDTRTGTEIGTSWWLGLTTRMSRVTDHMVERTFINEAIEPASESTRLDSVGSYTRMEIGAQLIWFRPPYRPTINLTHDLVQKGGLRAVIAAPYTLRLPWIPPATFIPEIALRIFGKSGDNLRFQHLSFTGLVEKRWRSFTFVPLVSLVIPRNAEVNDWIVWTGLHLGMGVD